MGLLAGTLYDPAAPVTADATNLLAMTALDTTNLRLTFTVPSNGAVLVRLRGTLHGQTTFAQVLLGCLEGATLRGRVVPLGALKTTAVATAQLTQEALYVVSGLTAGASLTWDAAYGVEVLKATSGIKYGGPNNTTTDDAWGGFAFEIYDTPNLLGSVLYDPTGAAAVAQATSSRIAMTAFDTTNARITFKAATTSVLWRIRCNLNGATTFPTILLGVLEGATVKARVSPVGGILGTAVATTNVGHEGCGVITGLTIGTSYTYDAAYGVEILLAATNIHYGGPNNNTTANDGFGALQFEIWAV
jgi:hypothetical protein